MKRLLLALCLLCPTVGQASSIGEGHIGKAHTSKGHIGGKTALTPLAPEDPLYLPGGTPNLDFPFAEQKNLTDKVSGKTSLVTFARSAAQSPGTYVGADGLIKTAAVNAQLYSEQIDLSLYDNSGVTSLQNQITAPDGKQTAEQITETASSTYHYVVSKPNTASIAGTTYTYSAFLKKGVLASAPDIIQVTFKSGGHGTSQYANFNLSTGEITATAGGTAAIESAGNGWYRCSFTAVATINQPTGAGGGIAFVNNNPLATRVPAYAGSTLADVYAWGFQYEEGSTPTAYIHTTSQTLAAPRFDHDPVTGESLGLLVEEARTNLFSASENMASATWVKRGFSAAVDLGFTGPLGAQAWRFDENNTDPNPAIYWNGDVTDGTPRVLSVWLKASMNDSIALATQSSIKTADVSVTTQWQKFYVTDSSDAGLGPHIGGFSTITQGSGISIYVSMPQIEAGTFPTSYIPTTSSAQTRYADVAAVQDEDFSTTNLSAYSESFDVGWSRTRLRPVVANATTAPDGQTTADYIEQQAGQTTAGGVYQSITFSGTDTASVYAKAAEKNFLIIYNGGRQAWFDLQNGTVGTITGAGNATISDAGNGWYRCSLTTAFSGAGNQIFYVGDSDGSTTVTDSGGIYLWGASWTQTEYPVAYTTTRNLLSDSQDFERATWVKTAAVGNIISSYSDPFGDNDATRLIDDNAGGTGVVYLSKSVTVATSTQKTFSVYAKADQLNWAHLAAVNFTSPASGGVYFDLSSGAIGASSAGITGQSENIGNGWYRISITFTTDSSDTSGDLRVYAANADGNVVVDRDSTSSIFIHGAQFEPGTTPTDYVRTVDVVGKDYGWYEPTEGTVFVEIDQSTDGTFAAFAFRNPSIANERITIYENGATNNWYAQIVASGASQLLQSFPDEGPGENKFSVAYKYNDANNAANGTVRIQDTSLVTPTGIEYMQIGYGYAVGYFNGHIKRLTYWPRRQSDSTLQVITQ